VMGSRLKLGNDEVWPPTASEVAFGYDRVDELLDPGVFATDLIREVPFACGLLSRDVYAPLIERLEAWGFAESPAAGAGGRLVCWHYDWRRDNRLTAARLSADLSSLLGQHGPQTELCLLAHSMGGLVARYALEVADPALGDVAWRGHVSLLATFGTPHRGAPLALFRALGMEETLGLSGADLHRMMAEEDYPAGYQLIPPKESHAFWDRTGIAPRLANVDVLHPDVASDLNLNASNATAAREFWQALAGGTRPDPARCRYFMFMGRGFTTPVRGERRGTSTIDVIRQSDAGDETVPIWSSVLPDTQLQLDGDEHSVTFDDREVLATLGTLLGVPAVAVRRALGRRPAMEVGIRLSEWYVAPGATVSAHLRVRASAPVDVSVTCVLREPERIDNVKPVAKVELVKSNIGAFAMTFDFRAPGAPGVYTLRATAKVRGKARPVTSPDFVFVVRTSRKRAGPGGRGRRRAK